MLVTKTGLICCCCCFVRSSIVKSHEENNTEYNNVYNNVYDYDITNYLNSQEQTGPNITNQVLTKDEEFNMTENMLDNIINNLFDNIPDHTGNDHDDHVDHDHDIDHDDEYHNDGHDDVNDHHDDDQDHDNYDVHDHDNHEVRNHDNKAVHDHENKPDNHDHDHHNSDHQDTDHNDNNHMGDQHTDISDTNQNSTSWSQASAYGYGTLANVIITLTSLSGIAIVVCAEKSSSIQNHYIFDFFITLAASTMLGDAFFHILPTVLGLHGHGDSDSHSDHDDHDDSAYMKVIGKIGVIVGVMYGFWVFESLVSLLGRGGHGHSHGAIASSPDKTDEETDPDEGLKWNSIVGILVGDVLHNFVDGLAIGVSWAAGWSTGLASSIAVILHELPHELGDFIIYKKFGLSTSAALGTNLFAACTSFAGLYIGLSIAHSTDAAVWLLACVTGLFIYIALVDVVRIQLFLNYFI